MRIYSKTTGLFFWGVLVIVFVAMQVSCSSDKCKFVNCSNGGTCDGGACICAAGYEGPLCETVSCTNFTGSRVVWDSGTLYGPVYYTLSIYEGSVITNLVIDSLYNYYFPGPLTAYIPDNDTFIIPTQMLSGRLVQGTGYFCNNQQIIVNYQVTDIASGVVDYRVMNWVK
jgi:hypothetical protein